MERDTMTMSLNFDARSSTGDLNEDARHSLVPPSPSNSESEVEEEAFKPKAKKPKYEKKEGVVKRNLPVVADAIIFLLELIIAVGFLYFAYIFPNRDRDCWANDYSHEPLQFCTAD
jgi:hypothetical protein